MNDLALIVLVAIVTFGSRVAFLARRRPVPEGLLGRFLEVFPLALFVALATSGLVAPEGSLAVTPALGGAAGGVVGAVATRRSLVGTILLGAAGYWLTRVLVG
ncbi:MAG: AzlD domain-containing protein [Acidimicrobiia bacterium]|nr:AzlD domain-containing protein [Acidimicrobiia bacterium]MDH5615207.1 AzlD domain-containing protein [Acidimicrobiia bacterium]